MLQFEGQMFDLVQARQIGGPLVRVDTAGHVLFQFFQTGVNVVDAVTHPVFPKLRQVFDDRKSDDQHRQQEENGAVDEFGQPERQMIHQERQALLIVKHCLLAFR